MARDFLLEIGTEEIPARFVGPALEELRARAREELAARRLNCGSLRAYGTPRRLALLVEALAERQADREAEVKGPAARAAFGPDGAPTKAAEGFARAQGVAVADLVVRSTAGGEYVFARKREAGRPAQEVLAELLPALISGLSFPRPMRWGEHEQRFIRPVHWLVALYGEEVIPLTWAGVRSGRRTRGHRFLAPEWLELRSPADYLPRLEEAFVIADQERRKAIIWQGVRQVAAESAGTVQEDAGLLEEVTQLVEYPTPLLGSFDRAFLELPEEVLITPMREHQRYFPVRDGEGRLLPCFVAVRNGDARHLDVVRRGNEKVLRARLADAAFFYREDLKEPLPGRVDRLRDIVFQESLGSMYQKTLRLVELATFLGRQLDLPGPAMEDAARAAYLCKADLTTSMVFEFPELQGIMGSYYAAHAGERASVCQAIREHYQPRFSGDEPPATPVGAVVGLADKVDSIVGGFRAGLQPTGSQDPYGMRRQALGIVHTVLRHGFRLSLARLAEKASHLYEGEAAGRPWEEIREEVAAFLRQRLQNVLEERGFAYDVVQAVLAAGWEDPADALQRAEALGRFRQEEEFAALHTALVRARNLARQGGGGPVAEALFQEEEEKKLFQALQRVESQVQAALARGDYLAALRAGASLRQPIDDFFAAVLVMAEDSRVRENRLALLARVSGLYAPLADFSQLVV